MNHLTLFGDLDPRVSGGGRLGQDRLVCRTAPPTHRPSPPVEDSQPPAVCRHHSGHAFVRPKKRPRRAQIPDLLAAVGVPEHDFLDIGSGVELSRIDRVVEKGVDHRRRLLQVAEPLEEGHDVDLAPRRIGIKLVQAGEPAEEQRRHDVVLALRHAHDEGAGRAGRLSLGAGHGGERG